MSTKRTFHPIVIISATVSFVKAESGQKDSPEIDKEWDIPVVILLAHVVNSEVELSGILQIDWDLCSVELYLDKHTCRLAFLRGINLQEFVVRVHVPDPHV